MEFRYRESSCLPKSFFEGVSGDIAAYITQLQKALSDTSYNTPEGFLYLPFDDEYHAKVTSLGDLKKTEKLKYIFLIGIGGSNLGAKAVYEAAYRFTDHAPEIVFLETINRGELDRLRGFVSQRVVTPEDFLVVVASKSGTTMETVFLSEMLHKLLTERFSELDVYNRTVFITDEDSPLAQKGKERTVSTLFIPKNVGGRFSFFSAVGIFPLYMAGVSTDTFLEEARQATERSLSPDTSYNDALSAALILNEYSRKEYAVHSIFSFGAELEGVSRWYRQIIAESLGKDGKNPLHPTTAFGTTDLHSMTQLYIDGPKNVFTSFIRFVDGVRNSGTQDIVGSIYEGVTETYKKEMLPFVEIEMGSVSECGAFFQMKMIETLIFAKLLEVDPFGQPAVELYKGEARHRFGL